MNPDRLHRVLLIGQVTLAGVFLFAYFRGISPLQGSNSASLIAYALSGISALQMVVALFVIKPRVPARSAAQSVEEYWSSASTTQPVLLVLFVLECATVIGAIGFFLTGDLLAAMVAGIAIGVFAWSRPSAFAER